jgi:hypothetical protein
MKFVATMLIKLIADATVKYGGYDEAYPSSSSTTTTLELMSTELIFYLVACM